MRFVVWACALLVHSTTGLDNGLAITPPMGWLHWERFRCQTNCDEFPDECINEKLFHDMADRLASDGYLEAGYEYVIIDDCWLSHERDSDGKLQADPQRFPNGIKALADYIHEKGLKFGLYEDYGTQTCGGYPGSLGHLETDANTFAEWGVDYLKFDGCNSDQEGMEEGHAQMRDYLNQTGRPIVFSCEFTLYKGIDKANYTAATEICNLWRCYSDIDDSWASVENIAGWFKSNQDFLAQFAGPGHWNDPDMLIIGNFGLSYEQSLAQMTIWCIMASPLIMSVDLRTINPDYRDILLNPSAIRVNQDRLGIQGKVQASTDNIDVWVKPILPRVNEDYSYALGIVSHRVDGAPYLLQLYFADYGLSSDNGYTVEDVFNGNNSVNEPIDSISVRVNPSGAVLLIVTPVRF